MTVKIIQGDCKEVLKGIPDQSVNCVVTSPPYYGLRDYGCEGQIGLEETPEIFLVGMVEVFREVRRVLRDDGTLWVNMGDSYASNPNKARARADQSGLHKYMGNQPNQCRYIGGDIKPKDLLGMPWRLALALQADGWYLRQDIIWHKPNPMPESVRDRCTKAHEYIFLLSKSQRYYFDFEANKEPVTGTANPRGSGVNPKSKPPAGWDTGPGNHRSLKGRYKNKDSGVGYSRLDKNTPGNKRDSRPRHKQNPSFSKAVTGLVEKRNRRSVWSIQTAPFSGAHFATFPPKLIEPCILAGCPEGGTVLDPFGGAGTTGLVADRLQRNAILIELNPEYVKMARERISDDAPLLSKVV